MSYVRLPTGDRGFESCLLQGRVREPSVPLADFDLDAVNNRNP
jgi:hypothetical protein